MSNGVFLLTREPPKTAIVHEQTIHYHVLMEPMGSNVFFLAPTARTLQGNYRMIAVDSGDAVFNLDVEHPVERYEATSALSQRVCSWLSRCLHVPSRAARRYLRVPTLDPRIPGLAEQIGAMLQTATTKR